MAFSHVDKGGMRGKRIKDRMGVGVELNTGPIPRPLALWFVRHPQEVGRQGWQCSCTAIAMFFDVCQGSCLDKVECGVHWLPCATDTAV
jgi:hypothetical protein